MRVRVIVLSLKFLSLVYKIFCATHHFLIFFVLFIHYIKKISFKCALGQKKYILNFNFGTLSPDKKFSHHGLIFFHLLETNIYRLYIVYKGFSKFLKQITLKYDITCIFFCLININYFFLGNRIIILCFWIVAKINCGFDDQNWKL